jgi:DNA-3-methyladenine glycosylase I
VFYDRNGFDLEPPTADQAVELVVAVAAGQAELPKLTECLASWARARSREPGRSPMSLEQTLLATEHELGTGRGDAYREYLTGDAVVIVPATLRDEHLAARLSQGPRTVAASRAYRAAGTRGPCPGPTRHSAKETAMPSPTAADGGPPAAASPQTTGITVGEDGVARCWWCGDDPLYRGYHDAEWGRPVADDRRLFEKLCLEGFQSGLSWLTILRKRENFRRAFDGFEIQAVARFGAADVDRLLADAGIVRNRAKIQATIDNARRCAELVDEFGGFAAYVWRFEPDVRSRPHVVDHATLMQLSQSPESKAMSKDLRRRGWSFVGPTTAYAFMEAMGLVNDHLHQCDVQADVEHERHGFERPRPAGPTRA